MDDLFRRFAHHIAQAVGSAWAFAVAMVVVLAWASTGPLFHFSETWQLVINTGTTIITFLMVFLIQNSQNRDARALHLKLDELILATKDARNRIANVEALSDAELETLQREFERLAAQGGPDAELHARLADVVEDHQKTRESQGPAESEGPSDS